MTFSGFYRPVRRLALASLALLMPLLTVIMLPAPAIADSRTAISSTLFGVDLGYLPKDGTLPKDKFGLIRLWDSGVYWGALELQANQWDFSRMDQVVAEAVKNGIAVLYTMGQTPTWASSNPTQLIGKHVYGAGSQYPPADIKTWRDYVRIVATRYKGKIQY